MANSNNYFIAVTGITITVFSILFMVLYFEFQKEYLIGSIVDVSENITMSAQAHESIEKAETELNSYVIEYDLFFLSFILTAFIESLYLAQLSKKEGYFSFLTLLFFGSLFILGLVGILTTVTEWFVEELFKPLLGSAYPSLPIMTFFVDNMGIISFLWFIILLFVNQLDFILPKKKTLGGFEK